jgi:prepilin-type N-terminal cleavage/methylation domain-containing protein
MMLHHFIRLNKNQRGFTLIELLVGIVITGIIATAMAGLVFQVVSVYTQVTNRVTVNNQVSNAVQWITSDSQMAQKVVVENGTSPNLRVALLQYGWDNSIYNVTYTINGNNELQRQYTQTDALGNITQSTIVVARYIDTGNTSCSFNSIDPSISTFGILNFQITSKIDGFKGQSATSQVQVITRFYLYKGSVLYDV